MAVAAKMASHSTANKIAGKSTDTAVDKQMTSTMPPRITTTSADWSLSEILGITYPPEEGGPKRAATSTIATSAAAATQSSQITSTAAASTIPSAVHKSTTPRTKSRSAAARILTTTTAAPITTTSTDWSLIGMFGLTYPPATNTSATAISTSTAAPFQTTMKSYRPASNTSLVDRTTSSAAPEWSLFASLGLTYPPLPDHNTSTLTSTTTISLDHSAVELFAVAHTRSVTHSQPRLSSLEQHCSRVYDFMLCLFAVAVFVFFLASISVKPVRFHGKRLRELKHRLLGL
eukprot:gnl/TRDRNA2_/TRDRNA2_151576_c0_seq2.p1 gnl/TRDRNA2_/TRDRNA2_151576_c0~~gnl/TRDRNA2_/TRDRNA2_151576_c0_seq2.p1  ORF type:complete len:289 (+),score=27.32 gnl/TRDRNA2_/TRDRNA2_151576_c0_seq2:78-944(+)